MRRIPILAGLALGTLLACDPVGPLTGGRLFRLEPRA